jgi:hypothetical protein
LVVKKFQKPDLFPPRKTTSHGLFAQVIRAHPRHPQFKKCRFWREIFRVPAARCETTRR